MNKIVIASHNKGKIKEYLSYLEGMNLEVLSLLDFPDFKEVEETGTTFYENALLKAQAFYEYAKIPCIADDSGLEVEALEWRPGVHSKRFTVEGTDESNNRYLVELLRNIPNRNARFHCHIVLYMSENHIYDFAGDVYGEIIEEPVYGTGFGYDPHFYLPEIGKTFSMLSVEMKNEISHRGLALKKCVSKLKELGI